ncbi:hypothetical protein [Spirosoma areae]
MSVGLNDLFRDVRPVNGKLTQAERVKRTEPISTPGAKPNTATNPILSSLTLRSVSCVTRYLPNEPKPPCHRTCALSQMTRNTRFFYACISTQRPNGLMDNELST